MSGNRPSSATQAYRWQDDDMPSNRDVIAKLAREGRISTIRPLQGLLPLIDELSTKSQAGTVLVSAGILDDYLEKLLLGKMRKMSNTKVKRIFNGRLESLSAKIDIAYAFELIDDELYDDLNVIRDIRNEFAHPVAETNFQSSNIVELIKKFKGWKTSVEAFPFFQEKIKSCTGQIEAKLSALSNG
jgi:DNA-binding MltR family transcriptional regulator